MEKNPVKEYDFSEIEQEKDDSVHGNLQKEINYCHEVYSIMHAFGDAKEPLDSSVKLMYNILHGQMALLITNAEYVMKLRKAKTISHEDILFLMRKNKVLLKRLLLFLFVEDTRACIFAGNKKLGDDFSPEKGERVSQCLKYLAFIEKFAGDLTSVLKDKDIVDHVYIKRLKRRDLMATSMSIEEYENFFEFTLRESFCHKYTKEKFKTWLQQCSCTKVDITPLALSIIHFLARETVAGIVDKAIEIKSRKLKKDNFPLEKFSDSDDLCHELGDESEKDFKMDESGNNLQPSFFAIFEDGFSRNENGNMEQKSIDISPGVIQEMNLFSKASHATDNIVNCPVATDTRKSMITENSIIDNSPKNWPKENTSSISSPVHQNNFSKSYASSNPDFNSNVSNSKNKISNHISDTNKNLNANAQKSKTKYDNSKSDDDKFSDMYYVVEETVNPNLNCDSTADQASSDILFHASDDSKKLYKKPYFSLNFQEKTLSVCCDGSKTYEVGESLSSKTERNNDIKGKSDVSKPEDFASSSLSYDFGKYSSYFSFVTPMKMNSKIYWFPEDAITPVEIQAAFIDFQRPSPMSHLMKTNLPYLPPRKTNLVCLANPDYFDVHS